MKYKLEEHVVAFIDILGSSKKIRENSEESLNIVHKVYENALVSLEQLYEEKAVERLKPIVRIYSDNIVIAVPTKQIGGFSAFISVAVLSGLIQHEFLHYKYLVRGGISMGDFFNDNLMLWGEALLDAYYIENNVSIYPRIVIHPKTVAKLNLAIDETRQKWIKQDRDGLFFIDYLKNTVSDELFIKLMLYRLKECQNLFLEVVGDVKLEQKIHWLNTYLHSKLDIYSPEYNKILKQEVEELESSTSKTQNEE